MMAISLRPAALQPGDRVAIVSPAGPAAPARVVRGVQLLKQWQLEPVIFPNALRQGRYLSAPDADRLGDLNAALNDPDIRAVFCTRGGFGTQRIVDQLDYRALATDPKVIVGFSDITALHMAIWKSCGLVTCYGPGIAWDDSRTGLEAAAWLNRLVMDPSFYPEFTVNPTETTAAVHTHDGRAIGQLLGGNLSIVVSTLGTPGFPSFAGAILLLEEIDESPYRIDRMLTQLRRARVFHEISGIVLGQFVRCGSPMERPTAVDVLNDRLGDLGLPILGGLVVGHGVDQRAVPFGVHAELDVAIGRVRTLEPAVSTPDR